MAKYYRQQVGQFRVKRVGQLAVKHPGQFALKQVGQFTVKWVGQFGVIFSAKRREREQDIKKYMTNHMYHLVKDIVE